MSDVSPGPVVTTSAGRVRGIWRQGSAAFLGIPFAAPPVGERRFDEPQPHAAWSAVRDADRYGPTPQRRPFGPEVAIPEPSIPGDSTLNINVFTPAPGDARARLPVLVWIHGGGFFAGSPASPWYDGASFNRDGVVTATTSYRLGFDGFGWIEDAPANRGVLDQIAALRWVRENIQAFGGDPGRVTIAGQSAGGGMVLTLLAAPVAQPLFAAAIVQSGAVRPRTLAAARELGTRFAARMGVDATRAGWSSLSEDQILDGQAELYARPAAEGPADERAVAMVRAIVEGEAGADLPFVPHVDDVVLRQDASQMISSGMGGDKPLLLGATAHEFTMATDALRQPLRRRDSQALLAAAGLGSAMAKAFADRFPGFDAGRLLGQVMTEKMFRLPLVDIVGARSNHAPAPTWLYDFRWVSPDTGLASHCLDLPFVWDLLDAEGAAAQVGPHPPVELARAMHGAWVDFIVDGSPGWPACTPEESPGMVFDVETWLDPDPLRFEAELSRMSAA